MFEPGGRNLRYPVFFINPEAREIIFLFASFWATRRPPLICFGGVGPGKRKAYKESLFIPLGPVHLLPPCRSTKPTLNTPSSPSLVANYSLPLLRPRWDVRLTRFVFHDAGGHSEDSRSSPRAPDSRPGSAGCRYGGHNAAGYDWSAW